MDNNIIEVLNEKNEKEKIEVLKYFTLKINQKDYIIYKSLNNSKNDTLIFSAEIEETENEIYLKQIKENEILEKIKNIMEELYNGWNYWKRCIWVKIKRKEN